MKRTWQGGRLIVLGFVLAVGIMMLWSSRESAIGKPIDDAKAGPGPHYTVVMTEAHNLLVTDNATNKLYFYTIDKDKPIGSPLKLRASVDLRNVGQEEIKITAHNLEKVEK